MTNGFALGGAATGFEAARRTGVLEDAQQLSRDRFGAQLERQTVKDADDAIANTMNIISQVIQKSREAGASPQKTRQAIAPLLADVQEIAQGVGRDPSRFVNAAEAAINIPQAPQQQEIVNIKRDGKSVSMFRDPRTGELTEIPGGTKQEQQQVGEDLFGVSVPPLVSDINEFDATVQKAFFKAQEKANSSAQLVDEMQIFKELVQTAQTGRLTSITLPIAQFFKEAGIEIRTDIPALEAIQAAQNQLALRLRNPESGFGLTGNTSDRDVTFLKDAVGGLQNTPEGNQAAVIIQLAKLRRQADLAAIQAELIARGSPQLFNQVRKSYIDQNSIFTDEERAFLSSLKGQADPRPVNELSDRELLQQLGR